jgi:alanyl-tRNA synthetase
MDSAQIRKIFLDFFESKKHKIVPSAPLVVKNDPSLMFTNAGMNQFKDIFLGNSPSKNLRVADTQKCLRVSGKHNDLEEVGHDTYHHTMFEMLGNWSFGDYFKKEAIEWAWELLTNVYGIPAEKLYVTVFEGDEEDGLPPDAEAFENWKDHLPEGRILYGSKKDNFWEMGETGPCGPCSEIHVDLRDEHDRKQVPGNELINKNHPQVLEIWNLVFIEFNRQSDGKLLPLPQKHVDTGMGFERLCMVLQDKHSNYDTDIFQEIIGQLSSLSGEKYGENEEVDIAMRVVADHLRAIAFAIADGQVPSNTGAGYVIRRILRRAVRYGFTFLNQKEPFIFQLVPILVKQMGSFFPELQAQQELIRKVIAEEEQSFLRTLSTGIKRFEQYLAEHKGEKDIDGAFAFELFDTYGFPLDLTRLMAAEKGWTLDMKGFQDGLEAQKKRSRQAAKVEAMDWIEVRPGAQETEFIGYDRLEADARVIKYRKVSAKGQQYYEIVLDRTPFYAESGGQVGDKGSLLSNGDSVAVLDTYRENEMIIHRTPHVFADMDKALIARVDAKKRLDTQNNHSATHLMHAALRKVLGEHVEQKGSLVDDQHLRFDFSHYARMTSKQIREIETIVNEKIRENILIDEKKHVPIEEAKAMGAMALFGEKYGEEVRVVSFDKDYSVELCGGTHVHSTGQIGYFKIVSEGAIAAGIRRIEAVTGEKAEEFIYSKLQIIDDIQEALKNSKDIVRTVKTLTEENKVLQKRIEELGKYRVQAMKDEMLTQAEDLDGVRFIATEVDLDAKAAKDLAFSIGSDARNTFLLLISRSADKINLTLNLSQDLVKEKNLNAGQLIRELAKLINGGGGGQPHFATAGGSNPRGIPEVLKKAKEMARDIHA